MLRRLLLGMIFLVSSLASVGLFVDSGRIAFVHTAFAISSANYNGGAIALPFMQRQPAKSEHQTPACLAEECKKHDILSKDIEIGLLLLVLSIVVVFFVFKKRS